MDSIKNLLTRSDKGRERAQGILCYMFRNTLVWKNINYHQWSRAANFYFEKPHNKANQDRGNLNKALLQDDLSWASFKKGLDLLSPYKAELTLELTWRSGRKSSYSIEIDPAEDESDILLVPGVDLNPDTDLIEDIVKRQGNKKKNTLARLYSKILKAEEIDLRRWNALVEDYTKNPWSGFKGSRKETAATTSSIQRQLFEPRLSWNNLRKGIAILAPVQEDYILNLQWVPEVKTDRDFTATHITIRDPFSDGVKHDQ